MITTAIHPKTRLGSVHLIVNNLGRQIEFYKRSLGFKCHWQEAGSAGLGAGGEDLLTLTEDKAAKRYQGTTGLYHTAYNVTTRLHFAHLLNNLLQTDTPISGLSNHGTHLAIYLDDAEGNGIELAWDFPQEKWPDSITKMLAMRSQFDHAGLIRESQAQKEPWQGLDPSARVGHVHLHVANRDDTVRFYGQLLGFETPAALKNMPPQFAREIAFFAAGEYHHHIGTNLWNGKSAPPPPKDALGLGHFTIVSPDEAAYDRMVSLLARAEIPMTQSDHGMMFRDPSQNGILLTWEDAVRSDS